MNHALANKLSRVERSVNVYTKFGEEVLEEINVDVIPFEKLIDIVKPREDDPLLYDGYELNQKKINAINSFLKNKIVANFETHKYFLVCGGVYEWGQS